MWNFGCTVSNSAGQSTAYYTPALDPLCSGCPTLAFEQNGILTDENPLLITSMSNPEKDVTDYYLINTPLSPVDNRINLTIHEPQTEHTWFDNISLIEAIAKPDEKIVVNEEGGAARERHRLRRPAGCHRGVGRHQGPRRGSRGG